MMQRVLIANRGEIAVRVIRACRDMGFTSIAVYSDVDRDAMHVRLADEAFAIGGESAAESYLNIESIVKVIESSRADAVHPGYGFLAENADFARAVSESGVTFVGPSAEAIATMGDKMSARVTAERAGVPVVPGRSEAILSPDEIVAAGDELGWPVAIKAAFGGGGRGMKVVAQASDAPEAFESATRESMAYFGRSELYVERYLSWPRHVEVQVLGDATGNILWLGDRDCSCQRRHQKLVEESPSPGIPADVRVAMGEAAVEVARACDYVNAGTIEFLYQDGEFYFLEMNTRLQVEHPVTELVTGIDLVEWQLRIASGDALTFGQEDIKSQGHAIEVRINAEEPSAGFAPSPGTISRFDVPAGPGIRVDAGYAAADAVNQHYDNLIAKLIVFGSDRESARRRVLRALHETRIDGVATTIPAHVAIMSSPEFANAEHSTKWVDERLDLSTIAPAVTGPTAGQGSEAATTRSLFVEVDGRRHAITVWGEGLVGFASPSTDAAVAPKQPTAGLSPWDPSAPVLHAPGALVSPLQGVIIKVMVELGDSVAAGDTLFLLESMKMENSINAEISGVVRELHASAGDMVQPGEVLAVVE